MRAEAYPTPSKAQHMTARVVGAFAGRFERSRVSIGYRIGMLGVLLALVVLPLLYVLMIAGACWLLLWHIKHDIVWFQYASGLRMLVIMGVAYLGVTIAGVISILFLTKPLFAPPAKQPPPVTLDPLTEPALFALIHGICDLMGAPRPTQVQVDCRVNASAGFRRGVASFFSHDLVLTLGMPLVAGMSVQQLAGVLAHEFGHFAQGGAMRVDYLVRSINFWFERLVHDRDPWDYKLDIMEEGNAARRFVGVTAKAMIWVGRLMLRWLMNVGGALSGIMSRQMEFDADACAARVVGSRGCTETLLRLAVLVQAQAKVGQEMFTLLRSGALPDNVPFRISHHERGMAEADREKVRRLALARDPAWWHTHPTLSQRREALTDLGAAGVFHLDDPAEELFTDFPMLCQTVSVYWYEVVMGLDLNRFDLVGMEPAVPKPAPRRERHEEAVREVFGCPPPLHRLIPLPDAAPDHATQVALVEAWKAGYEAACVQEKHLRTSALNQTMGYHLAHLGFGWDMLAGLEMDLSSPEAAQTSQTRAMHAYQTFSGQMQVFEQAAWSRIAAALGRHYQQMETRQEWRDRVGLLVRAQRALAAAAQHLESAAVNAALVKYATESGRAHPAGADVRALLGEHDQQAHTAMLRAVEALHGAAAPGADKGQRLSQTIQLVALPKWDAFHSIACHPPLLLALAEQAALVTGELCALTLATEREHMSAVMQAGDWRSVMVPAA